MSGSRSDDWTEVPPDIVAAVLQAPEASLQGRSLETGKYSFRKDPYSVRLGPGGPSAFRSVDDIRSLTITRLGRFSNSLLQLAGALRLVPALPSLESVHVAGCWYLPERMEVSSSGRTIELVNHHAASDRRAIECDLAGMFFYRRTLKPLIRRAGDRCVSDLLEPLKETILGIIEPPPASSERELTIHVRAGDLFRGNGKHPGYGQPPLAYYVRCVEHFEPSRVRLVFETRGNPVIDALEERLEAAGYDFVCQSSQLRDDVATLLAAQTLVAGKGSFIQGVAALSRSVCTVYAFEGIQDWTGGRVRIVCFRDATGEYKAAVMSHNWENTDEQRALMIDYPIDKIDLSR